MAEKFIKNFQDNFKLSDIMIPWQQQIKNLCNNTKVNCTIY